MRVIVKESAELLDEQRSNQQYGSWSETWQYGIDGVRVDTAADDLGYDEEGYLLPAGSTMAHVLWMTYDTGDSFGNATGKGCILGVFADRKLAEAALAAVEKQIDEFTIKVKDDFGREISISNPGAGYFEHVQTINLDSYSLENASIRRTFR